MTESHDPTAGGWASHQPVVVGVDGSDGCRSALAWAAAEAAAAGADLHVVTAVDHRPSDRVRRRAERTVAALAADVDGVVPPEQLSHAVYDGAPERELLDNLHGARMLVVGKRGLGTLSRMFVGSTSLALAGRSPVAVAVVPTGWDQAAHRDEPVVVGVEPDRPHHRLMHLAFRRAERLGVPLVLVHGWEPPGTPPAEAHDVETEGDAHARFEAAVTVWRNRFPAVNARTSATSKHPAVAVLDEADSGAQLVLLGRHHSNRFAGFGFGSVTRAVLHYAHVPVLVVPTDED